MRSILPYWPLALRIALTVVVLWSISITTPFYWVAILLILIWAWDR